MRVPHVSERIKEAPAQALRGVFAGIGQLLLYTDKLRNKAPFGQQVPYARVPEASQAAPTRAGQAESVPDPTAATAATAASAASAPADRDAAAEPAVAETPRTPKTPRTSRAPKTPKIPAAPKTPRTPKTPAAATEIRDFDKTGNVRLITGDEARADDQPPAAGQPTPPAAEAAPPIDVEPPAPAVAEPEPAAAKAEEEAPASASETAPGTADSAPPPVPNYDEMSIASLRARLRNLDVTQVRGLVEYEKGHAGRTDVIVMLERRIAKLEADD